MTFLQDKKTDKYYVSEIDFHNNPPFDLIQEIGRLFSMDYVNVKALVQFAIIWQEQVEAAEKDLLIYFPFYCFEVLRVSYNRSWKVI